MTCLNSRHHVVVEAGPVGWHVWVEADADTVDHESFFEEHPCAQAYAQGLSLALDLAIDDRTTGLPSLSDLALSPDHASAVIVIEQLTRSQWHAVDTRCGWGSGVTSWPDALATALWAAMRTNQGVESVSLYGDRLTLARPEYTV